MNSEVDTVATQRPRNRLWPEALKREIIAASVSVVARRYDVNTNQLFAWRKLYRTDDGTQVGSSSLMLFPVTVTAEPEAPAASTSSAAAKTTMVQDFIR
jgi:transposase